MCTGKLFTRNRFFLLLMLLLLPMLALRLYYFSFAHSEFVSPFVSFHFIWLRFDCNALATAVMFVYCFFLQPTKSKWFVSFYFEICRFTSWQAFRNVLREISDLAGQREIIAESLQAQVINAITLLSKNLRDERKKALNDGSTYQQNLSLQIAALDRAKRNYEKSYRDAEKAVDSYQRADADLNLSRAEVEKQRHNMASKNQQSDDAKNEYANQLQKTNKLQQQHYEIAIPDVFNRLQEIDEKRTGGMKEFIKRSADVELSVAPIIARCLEGISKAAESIDEKDDSQKVIERYASLTLYLHVFPFDYSHITSIVKYSRNTIDTHTRTAMYHHVCHASALIGWAMAMAMVVVMVML